MTKVHERILPVSDTLNKVTKLRSFMAAVPFLTLLLIVVMFVIISAELTSEKGFVLNLPDTDFSNGDRTDLVALVMPSNEDVLIFFDDARFSMGNSSSMESFQKQLSSRIERSDSKTLLVLLDKNVSSGNAMKLSQISQKAGVKKMLFAEKRKESNFR